VALPLVGLAGALPRTHKDKIEDRQGVRFNDATAWTDPSRGSHSLRGPWHGRWNTLARVITRASAANV